MHYGWRFDYSLIIMFTLLPWRLNYLHVMIQGTSNMVFHVDNFTVLISWLSFQIPRIVLHMGSATFIGWAHTQNNPGYTSTKKKLNSFLNQKHLFFEWRQLFLLLWMPGHNAYIIEERQPCQFYKSINCAIKFRLSYKLCYAIHCRNVFPASKEGGLNISVQ